MRLFVFHHSHETNEPNPCRRIPFYLSLVGWKSNGLEFDAWFTIKQGEEFIDHKARLRWDPDRNSLTALPD